MSRVQLCPSSGNRSCLRLLMIVLALCFAANSAYAQTVDTSFDPNANADIRTIVIQPDGKILLGGNFTSVGGQTRSHIARLNADGALDTSFIDANVDSVVSSIAVQPDGKILIGGFFSSVGVNTRFYLARLNSDGTLDSAFNPNPNDLVFSISVQSDGKILVGGSFTFIGGQARAFVARLNSDGTLDTSFVNTSKNGTTIYSTPSQSDGKIIIGGDFTSIGGNTRNRVARLNSDGTLDLAFNPNVNSFVYTVAVQPDDKVLFSGLFSSVGGTTRPRLARLNPDGTLDTTFNPTLNSFNIAFSIAFQADGKILLGGQFFTIEGQSRNNIARLNSDGTLDSIFNPNANDAVASIALQSDGKILIGGYFTTIGGIGGLTRNRIARLNNSAPAEQTLTATSNSITWTLTGSSPELCRATFEQSTDGVNYTLLGNASRSGETWQMNGLSLPNGQPLFIRARGFYSTGVYNASRSILESVQNFNPTGASVSVGGRVSTVSGRSIYKARVTMTSANGFSRTALTNPFGYYRFTEVTVGEIYVFEVSYKGYNFNPQVMHVSDEIDDLNFTAFE